MWTCHAHNFEFYARTMLCLNIWNWMLFEFWIEHSQWGVNLVTLIILKCFEVVLLECFLKDLWKLIWYVVEAYFSYFCIQVSRFSLKWKYFCNLLPVLFSLKWRKFCSSENNTENQLYANFSLKLKYFCSSKHIFAQPKIFSLKLKLSFFKKIFLSFLFFLTLQKKVYEQIIKWIKRDIWGISQPIYKRVTITNQECNSKQPKQHQEQHHNITFLALYW